MDNNNYKEKRKKKKGMEIRARGEREEERTRNGYRAGKEEWKMIMNLMMEKERALERESKSCRERERNTQSFPCTEETLLE